MKLFNRWSHNVMHPLLIRISPTSVYSFACVCVCVCVCVYIYVHIALSYIYIYDKADL
jgi:hypothetical protein